jgi:hypothetical protein
MPKLLEEVSGGVQSETRHVPGHSTSSRSGVRAPLDFASKPLPMDATRGLVVSLSADWTGQPGQFQSFPFY